MLCWVSCLCLREAPFASSQGLRIVEACVCVVVARACVCGVWQAVGMGGATWLGEGTLVPRVAEAGERDPRHDFLSLFGRVANWTVSCVCAWCCTSQGLPVQSSRPGARRMSKLASIHHDDTLAHLIYTSTLSPTPPSLPPSPTSQHRGIEQG